MKHTESQADYDRLWRVLYKHICGSKKQRYSKEEVIHIICGLEETEKNRVRNNNYHMEVNHE